MNPDGTPSTLVAAHPGNRNAERSSIFARRNLANDPEVQELAELVMRAPHTTELDEIGAIEIAKLMVLLDRVDADLAARGITKPRSGEARALLTHRNRLSGRLAEWLDRYGMTPKSRAEWARTLAQGGLADEIRRRQAEARARMEGA